MRIRILLVLAALAGLSVAPAAGAAGLTGNGGPSGKHYQLNIIGVKEKAQAAEITRQKSRYDDGRRLFVRLYGKTTISLKAGAFGVIDYNGTDGSASFSLPRPDADADGTRDYEVYARALGKPGGSSSATTCFTDTALNETYCSLRSAVSTRWTGRSKFTNVSAELLYVDVDVDGDGTIEHFAIFDNDYEYFWSYDSNGMKLLQLRFYANG